MLLRWLTHRNKAKWGRNIYEGAFCCFLELKITNMYTRLYSHWSLSRTRQIWKILRPLPPIYLHWVFWKVWNSPVWNIQFDELDFFSISNLDFAGYSRKNQFKLGKNPVHQIGYFKLKNCNNQLQIDRRLDFSEPYLSGQFTSSCLLKTTYVDGHSSPVWQLSYSTKMLIQFVWGPNIRASNVQIKDPIMYWYNSLFIHDQLISALLTVVTLRYVHIV